MATITWDKLEYKIELTGKESSKELQVLISEVLERSNSPYKNEKGFYQLFSYGTGILRTKKKLLYVGMTFKQSLEERIPQDHEAYDCVIRRSAGGFLFVKIGMLASSETDTKNLYERIECCLICDNQPPCNGKPCRKDYPKRTIQVINKDGNPLNPVSTCFKDQECERKLADQ